ncbi:MAG: hypothetical protein A2942_00415 [Candidatus Lloydbacteria bacterium RIFCSPLOWO2_01_FULL_50_20]|uniref:Methyltransferase small domain-containing protein n=1 Tax=Candidatus Lloydbacteria bacterium RIFCSPLOWO2_01_FULL_50_20 TaxID=1798665 RepID=A0A1G2DCA7_9BACT|nr:MAG: hypothetical protein A3C13_02225 [Candidatus Lloydbacteria bacterium RIFCSPHIGHO2_02_FULL_50_11]OGZ11244.1 MAG: hypothetical protein A2942_00415 [Candidatus Lloydbacteria bacterium RIFCSPLOWO2_01_FULL_50_20]
MILRFSKDLREQHIYANGTELASVMGKDRDAKGRRIFNHPKASELFVTTIKNPVLVTDVYRIAQMPPTVRDTIFKLYESPVRRTEYGGVALDFEQGKYKGAWGPSIDTLLFCRALNKMDRGYFRGKSLVDIGAGSGFISKYILGTFPGVRSATLVDLSPHAIVSCKDNIKDKRAKFVCGDAIRYIKKRKFDVIVCNPPYIPRERSSDDNPYEGILLTTHLFSILRATLLPGGCFLTNISSLSEKDVYAAMKKYGITAVKLDTMNVPLKVMNVLNNKAWMRYLKKCGLKRTRRGGYEYYQSLTIVRVDSCPGRKEKGAERKTPHRK